MSSPVHSLRVVFALSMFACSLILLLFVRGRAAWTTEFWLQWVAAAIALSTADCLIAFRKGTLRVQGVPLLHLARVFARQLVLMYIVSALAITALALAVVYAITRSAQDALALAVLAGLWLSLWLAPGLASLTSWHKLRAAQSGEH